MKSWIKIKLIVSFLVMLILTVSFGVASYINFSDVDELAGRVDHTYQVLNKLEEIFSILKDAENAQRGYVITNNTRYLEPYDYAIEVVNPMLKGLYKITEDNPQQQKRLDELQLAVDSRLGDIEEAVYLRMNVGYKQALDVINSGYGKKHMGKIRELIATMISAEKALLDIRIKKRDAKVFISNIMIWILMGFTSIIVIFVGYAITRSIVSGINHLRVNMDKLATENLNVSIAENRNDEIGSLYLGFNQAVRMIKDSREELSRLIRQDELTGISNRDFFYETIDNEYRRAARDKKILSLIICDIDYFRHFNDTYGHVIGDECLKKVAGAVSQTFQRAGELTARIGGEEFAIILPATEPADIAILSEMLRQAVWLLKIPHGNSKVADRVTISVGAASVNADKDQNFEVLVQAADKALEQAKKKGRNRIELMK